MESKRMQRKKAQSEKEAIILEKQKNLTKEYRKRIKTFRNNKQALVALISLEKALNNLDSSLILEQMITFFINAYSLPEIRIPYKNVKVEDILEELEIELNLI